MPKLGEGYDLDEKPYKVPKVHAPKKEVSFRVITGKHYSMRQSDGTYADFVCVSNEERKYADVRRADKPEDFPTVRVKKILLEPSLKADVNQRYKFFEQLTGLCVRRKLKALFVSGKGGIGKSFTVEAVLTAHELIEEADYVLIKGFSTARGLYETLEENNDRIIVFDDCDPVLTDKVSVGLLKVVLDSFAKRRIVKWLTSSRGGRRSSNQFEFTGVAIFLSNLPLEKIDEALKSRCTLIDLSMTPDEIIDRLEHIVRVVHPHVPIEMKEEILQLLSKYRFHLTNLNIRTLEKAIVTYFESEDLDLVRNMILNS